MQRTADVHDHIADTRLPEAVRLVHHATALHTAVDRLEADAPTGDAPMGRLLRAREGPAARLLGRPDDLNLWERTRQQTQVLEPSAACRHGRGGCSGTPLVMHTARRGLTQQEAAERRVEQPHVLHRLARFLAAITARWLRRSRGALEAPCGPSMATRGAGGSKAGAAVGASAGGPVGGTTLAAAAASATPRRGAKACTDRGAPPPACAGSPGGPPGGQESTAGLCSGPSRTAAPAPLGGGTS